MTIYKGVRLVFVFVMLLPVQAVHAQNFDDGFFKYIEDLPLMPGLEELEDQSLMFDKPEGRIVQSVALIHEVPNGEVLSYYQTVLPQFGWSRVNDRVFARDGEHLKLLFDSGGGNRFLNITLKPKG